MGRVGIKTEYSPTIGKKRAASRPKEGLALSYTLMALATTLLSLPLPLAIGGSHLTGAISYAACTVAIAVAIFTYRSFLSAILSSLLFTFAISYFGDPTPIAILFGALLCSGLYSAAVARAKRIHIFFLALPPVCASAISYLLTGEITASLLPVACLLPALILGLCIRRGVDRSRALAYFAATAILELAAAALTHIYLQNGAISLEIIEHAASYTRELAEGLLLDAIASVNGEAITESLVIEIRVLAIGTVNLLPGLVCATAVVTALISQGIARSLLELHGEYSLTNGLFTPVSTSLTAALIFVACHILSFTSSPTNATSFLAVAAENLSLVLMPLLLLIGFDIMAALPKKIGLLSLAAWIAIVLISNLMSSSILTSLALIGAFNIIFVRTDRWAKDHYSKGENQ